jgi:hypothetical protein
MTLGIIDSLGCTADTTFDVSISDIPAVFAGGFITVCRNDTAQLNAIVSGGVAPYNYLWTPSVGLSNDSIVNPVAYNTNGTSYCVTVTDANNCTSTPDCVTINQYPQPTITAGSANLCASQSNLQNTFTVSGPNPGANYSWRFSPSYSLITGAAGDSSSITATFPAVPGTYAFIAVIYDTITGCTDTVPTAFTVTAGLSMSVSGPTNICEGDTATLIASGATTYSWSASPSYSFADSTLATQSVLPSNNTTFTITGTTGTCTQTITRVLNVGAKPLAIINPISPFCGCATVSLNGIGSTPGMTYLWTSQSGSSIVSPSNLVTNAQICGIDVITFTVTDNTTTCSSDTTYTTISRPKPNAQAAVTPNLICNGTSTPVNLDGSGSNTDPLTTYHWSSVPSVAIADTAAMSTTATVTGATTFTLLVTDSAGCDSTVTATVNIYPPPSISANQPFICSTDSVLEATISITGVSIGSTYNWTSIPGCVTPSSTSSPSQLFDFAGCGAGIYNFDVTVTDPITTCVTDLSQSVTIVSGVVLNVTPDTAFCEGGTTVLYASGANSYAWSSGDSTDTVTVTGLTATGSPYSYIVTGTIGSCTASETIIVNVNPTPVTSSITGPITVCENDPASVYDVTPVSGNYTWTVTGGVIVVGQGSNNIVVNWNSTGVGTISVVDTNSFGCPGLTQTLNVIINPLPDTPAVTGPAIVCADAIETYFVNPNAGSTYYWAISGGTFVGVSTGTVLDVQWGSTSPGSLTVYEVSSGNCIGPTVTYNVTINPRPLAPAIIGNNLVCDNIPEIYTVGASAGSIYSWSVLNNLHDTVTSTTDSVIVNWGTAGSGQVQVFETNSFGCISDTAIFAVTINQHPILILPNDSAAVCNNSPYQIVASSNTTNVFWYSDGTGNFNDTTIASPVYTPSASDTGYIHLTMVAGNSPCMNDSVNMVLYVSPSPVISIIGPTGPICYGTTDSLRAFGGGTYIWTPGGIPSDIIGIRPLVSTTYTVAVTNSYNCTSYDSITVDVIPPGIPDAGPDVQICAGDSAALSGTQINAGGILWATLGDGIFLPDSTSSLVDYVAGVNDTVNGIATIVLTTTGACLNLTDTLDIQIGLHPFIEIGNDTTLPTGGANVPTLALFPVTLNVSGVQWTTSGTGTFSPSDTTINATYIPSTEDLNLDTLIISVTTTGSCPAVLDYLVIDFAPFYFPNVFTPYPSSPGYNDFFVIRNLTEGCELKIFDRWGLLVYSSEYYQNDWDAYGLNADVYYYVLEAGENDYKGWVQVIRGE